MIFDASKRLLSNDIEKLKRLRRDYVLKCGRNILFCIIFLSLFAFSYNNIISYEDTVIHNTFLLKGTFPVSILAMKPKQEESNIVAIITPGIAGSKERMVRLGTELTKAGIASYLFDLPSNAALLSPTAANKELSQQVQRENVTALEEVISYIQSHRRTIEQPSILLIGYSTGSTTISDYLETHSTEHNMIFSILLSPVDQHIFTVRTPTNLLILTGAYDTSSPVSNKTLQQICRQRVLIRGATIDCQSPVNGGNIREVILPFLDNSLLPLSLDTPQAIIDWVHSFHPHLVEPETMSFDIYLCWLFLAIAGAYLAVFPFCRLLINIFMIHSIPRVLSKWNTFFLSIFLLASIATSLVISSVLLQSIRLSFENTIVSYFFCITAITTILMLVTQHILPFPLFRQTVRQFLVGTLVAVFLCLTLGQLIQHLWTSPTMTEATLLHSGVLFVLLWPTYLLYTGITRSWHESRTTQAWLLSNSFKVLFLLSLLAALSLMLRANLLVFFWPIALILFLFLEGCCSQLYKSGRATIAGATASAIFMVCILVAFSPSSL